MQNNLTYRFQKHVHKYWEITYYFEGSGKNITENRDIYFQKGTIVCQPPGMIHEDISETGYKNIYFCVENFALAQPTPLILNDTPNSDFLYILRQLPSAKTISAACSRRIRAPHPWSTSTASASTTPRSCWKTVLCPSKTSPKCADSTTSTISRAYSKSRRAKAPNCGKGI